MDIEATVDPSLCVVPIYYALDFDNTVSVSKSIKFNSDKMDLDIFLGTLRATLGSRPLPGISTLEELVDAVDFLNNVILAAMEASTPHHLPCSVAKHCMCRCRRWYQQTQIPSARAAWLLARCEFYRAISDAKHQVWTTYLQELQWIDIYDTLKRMKEHQSSVFPAIYDQDTGNIALSHTDRGRVLGHSWFGSKAVELSTTPQTDVIISPERRPDFTRGAVDRLPPPPSARQDLTPTSPVTSEARSEPPDPISLAESVHIFNERPFVPPPDSEIDKVIMSSPPWRQPDRYGIQMGHIQRAYSILGDWIRPIYRASLVLGAKPSPFKANTANPFHKHVLAKPLERLVADRISFEAESMGFFDADQYGGHPGHSTYQAVDGHIHRVRMQLDAGNTVSTCFYDLKGAYNRISHEVVVREMAWLGYSRAHICLLPLSSTVIVLPLSLMGFEQ
ncbi:hypothetical protein B0H16DRAFT_1847434 [Mycena metata]|uniref:Reverse transcriptase domain-containing protein n=1 Tax=Mycena metata TaxID=1033252 RepID=A0AAD7ITU6_9AGAR|nr:hypothetical protein B0H16DRAFT_1847434 [Mycena metata]